MPVEITMPQLSDTMSEGTLIKWHKKEGDAVKEGDVIAEVETDKATMDMEAFEAGTMALIAVPEGSKVKVGQQLAVLAAPGEDRNEVKSRFAGSGVTSPQKPIRRSPRASAAGASTTDTELGRKPLEEGWAKARHESVQEPPTRTSETLAREAEETVAKVAALQPIYSGEHRVSASPLARRLAEENGIDLRSVKGSGPGGRIVQEDIQLIIDKAAGKAPPVKVPEPVAVPGNKQVIPLTKMRLAIATRLQQSKQNPHFYETMDIDVEQVSQLRAQMNKHLEKLNIRLSIGDFVTRAVCLALQEHPALNATFDGREVTRYASVNLGMAVALPEGLTVPVMRNVETLNLREIRLRSADLAERARGQRLKQTEITGATFTVSNLGMYGLRQFSAIINPPEVAILAVGAAEKRPVVRDDQIVARTMMTVTLSVDHRAVDGATAAEFLRTLKAILEEPGAMLV